MKLYLIVAQASLGDGDGPHNLDLFVSAKSSRSAANLWRKHYQDMADEADDGKVRVFEVPTVSATSKAHAWDDIGRKEIRV